MKIFGKTSDTTLGAQLMRGMIVLFVLALSGLFAGYWLSTRSFVERQLASHAQDAASSLALALSSTLKDGDLALAETTVMPIFDRGYYRSLVVRDISGKVLIEKKIRNSDAVSIPAWFRRIVNLDPPVQHAVVSAGWRQIGHVEVISEPRFAYEQLWRSLLRMSGWMLVILAISMLATRLWLRDLLLPLGELESAAQDIAGRHFRKLESVPKAVELKRLTEGFNKLVDAVQALLRHEEDRAERFRVETFSDPMTGMLNRRGLIQHTEDELPESAWLGIIECSAIGEINRDHGFEAGNELITTLAKTIIENYPDAVTARLSAAGFAVVVVGPLSPEIVYERFMMLLATLNRSSHIAPRIEISSGWARRYQRDLGKWLAAADLALSNARHNGISGCVLEEDSEKKLNFADGGSGEWSGLIVNAMENRRLRLYIQPAFRLELAGVESIHHNELLTVLVDENNEEIPASRWLGMASRQGFMASLDKIVMEMLAGCLDLKNDLAINLSVDTWINSQFIDDLPELAKRLEKDVKIIFELRESEVVHIQQAAVRFAEMARSAGFGIAIDRFGVANGGIAALREVLPDYIKLDPSIVARIDKESGKFHLESLVAIADTLDIEVVALMFGKEDLSATLVKLGVNAVQGDSVDGRKLFMDCKCSSERVALS